MTGIRSGSGNGTGSGPAARLAALLSVVLLGTGCGGGSGDAREERTPAPTGSPSPTPIVLVHGLGGSPADWDQFRRWFARDGDDRARTLPVDLTAGRPNDEGARTVARAVERLRKRTGAARVDLVAFSMGNLSARHYLKHLGGTSRVRSYAGIAGPNRGMDTALTAGCGPRTRTDVCQMGEDSEFLRELNRGDETPGRVRYATWRSRADDIVPADSTPLAGAENHVAPDTLGHVELIGDRRVYREIRDFLRAG
ncbi:alpha/beta fold hydrolase [Streptomyces boncukensis]|uniref:Alpha/beta fold hydrolase n=1 Tax=Streptomyces boncukensis TaxID=2711219 RepID=A0A6G4WQP0_9ACTN|nr:alpha/beta fold hydrolase [Streptomyces boncukensis]